VGQCSARIGREAGGDVFMNNSFGWMVHVYPFEDAVAQQF
jgi:hypothetical protein